LNAAQGNAGVSAKMKGAGVLMVGPSFECRGGIAAVAEMQHQYLLSKNFRVFFLASTREGHSIYRALYTLASYVRFITVMVTHKIRLVHVHSSSDRSFYRKLFYIVTARLLGKSVILQIHAERFYDFYLLASPRVRRCVEKIFRDADAIIVLSLSIRQSFSKISPSSNILVLGNPVRPSLFECKKAEEEKEKIVLYMGWLAPEKGVYDILDVIPEVLARYPSARFVFCGEKENNGFRTVFKNSPFKDSILVKGWLVGEAKADLFCRSTMLVLPSYSEGFPNVILEAMSSSLPIVATSVGAIPEVIEDGINGLLISPGDKEALKEKIIWLLENPESCKQMGTVNKKLVTRKYDIEIVGKELVNIYLRTLTSVS
jgi:glycosyltransferase involved in cell wall biosynthesis